MSQMSFGDAEYAGKKKRTRREQFLSEMDQVVPWKSLIDLIEPVYPVAGRGRRPYPLPVMLRVHLMQNWFGLSDPATEEALYEIVSMRAFAGLSLLDDVPDETTILNFRRLIETHGLAEMMFERVNAHLRRKGLMLRKGTIVDATIIAAPSSTKNQSGERDPEMDQTRKGEQWYFGMKAHIGVDAESGLVHTVVTSKASEADVTKANELLHGKEVQVRGGIKAMASGVAKRKAQKLERAKARARARVEHPFQTLKCVFGYRKARFKGLAKNTAQIVTLFALVNLHRARKKLMALMGSVRPVVA
jgi:transposase, IS5 family